MIKDFYKIGDSTDLNPHLVTAIVILIGISFLILPFFFPVFWGANDDYKYHLILSGLFTGEPSPYTVFLGYSYSSFVSWIYEFSPQIPWYPLFHELLSVLAVCLLSKELLSSKYDNRLKIVLLLFLLATHLSLSFWLYNTKLALELGFVSLILIANHQDFKSICLAYILFFIGLEVRFSAVFIPFMIAFPICFIGRSLFCLDSMRKCLFLVGLILVAVVSNTITSNAYNSSRDWVDYIHYNQQRGYLADNKNAMAALDIINSPIKKLDYEMLIECRDNDGQINNTEDLVSYSAYVVSLGRQTISQNMVTYWGEYCNEHFGVTFLLFILTILFSITHRNWDAILWLIIATSFFIIANAYMMSVSVAKVRVVLGVHYAFACVIVLLANRVIPKFYRVAIPCTAFFIYQNLYDSYVQMKLNYLDMQEYSYAESVVRESGQKKMMVLNYVKPSVFDVERSIVSQSTVRGGWLTNSPLSAKYYKGYESYIDGLPIFVSLNNMKLIYKIQKIIKLNSGIDTSIDVLSKNEKFQVIRLRKI